MLLAAYRSALRRDLKDEDSGNYRWTDNELDRAIDRAVSIFSNYMPYSTSATIETVDDSYYIDIETVKPRYSIDAVEFPVEYVPPRLVDFTVYEDVITMSVKGTGDNCFVYYTSPHTLTIGLSTIPAQYDNLVLLGASAYAVMAWSQYGTNRANTGGDGVDRDYLYWAKGREQEFMKELKRISTKLTRRELYAAD